MGRDQIFTLESSEPVTIREPFADHFTHEIPSSWAAEGKGGREEKEGEEEKVRREKRAERRERKKSHHSQGCMEW